jgi:hypothetical protein
MVRFFGGGIFGARGVGPSVGSYVGDKVGTTFKDVLGSSSTSRSALTPAATTRVFFFWNVSTLDMMSMACKLAIGVIILGIIVGMRFLGPAAVVQCSTFPVPSSSSNGTRKRMNGNFWERDHRDAAVDGNVILDRFLVRVFHCPLRWLRALVMPTPPPLEQEQQQESWDANRFSPTYNIHSSTMKPGSGVSSTGPLPVHPAWHVPSQKEPKRRDYPTLSRIILLLFLHGYFGALYAQSTILPLFVLHRGFHEIVTNHVVCSCALMTSFTFLATYIFSVDAQAHHELDMMVVMDAIKHIQHKDDTILMMRNMLIHIADRVWKQIVSCGLLFYWSVTPFLCLGIIGCKVQSLSWMQSTQSQAIDNDTLMLWPCLQAIVISTSVTLIMSLYIMACDIALRIVLLIPGLNAHRFILKSGAKEQDLDVEDVMVEIILGGLGAGFLEYTVAPRLIVDRQGNLQIPHASSKKRGYSAMGMMGGIHNEYDLEEEELRRNDTMTWMVQRCIEQGRICGHTTLEDDLLKVNILESFGGNGTSGESDTASFPMGLSERHYREVARRILAPEPPKGTSVQPAMVPVLRALSAYIGGIGASLSVSSNMYYVSPCTKTTLEYAVNAASRFIVLNFGRSFSDGYSKKRFNRINLMTPVVLEAIYRLRCGICDLACYLYENDKINKISLTVGFNGKKKSANENRKGPWVIQSRERLDSILSNDPSLEHLVTVCDKAGQNILKKVQEVDGSCDFDAKVRADGCSQWLISLD